MDPIDADETRAFRQFFATSLELLAVAGSDGRFRVLNPAWEKLLGWSEAELQAEPLRSFLHPADVEETLAELAQLAVGKTAVSFLSRFRHANGEHRDLRWSASTDDSNLIYVAARDVTDHRRAVAEAKDNEGLWRSVLATAADPVILIDANGSILEANPATTALFHYDTDQLLGNNVSMLMPDPYRTEHDGYLDHYQTTGEARIIGIGREVQARRADGTVFPIHLAVSEVTTERGSVYTGIIHDLTELRAASDRLQEANDLLERRVTERTTALESSMIELRRSNRDLEQFAYIASHDLQAPLRNVRQGLELLNDHLATTTGDRFDDEATELQHLIVGAVGHMEDLIQGLLSYSRLQRHGRQATEAVDLDALAADVLTELRADLEQVGATVDTDPLPTVAGDRVQLHQLFQNLLENAVKYGRDEVPTRITISTGDDDDRWLISVADNGIGVDESHHERIFELFRRGHVGYDGVGLGLAICQRIVERHGGEIWVRSQPGEGATFTFSLPKVPPPKADLPTGGAPDIGDAT